MEDDERVPEKIEASLEPDKFSLAYIWLKIKSWFR